MSDKRLVIWSSVVAVCSCIFVFGVWGGGMVATLITFPVAWVVSCISILHNEEEMRREEEERKALEKSVQVYANSISLCHSILNVAEKAMKLGRAIADAEENATAGTR
jgi:hypothetical protein